MKAILELDIPEKVQVAVEDKFVIVKGPLGEIKKELFNPNIRILVKDNKVILESKKFTRKEKRLIGTFRAHIKNMIQGVIKKYSYILKICSSHFPMNVSVTNNMLVVKNFMGEKKPRVLKLKEGVDVRVEGDKIIVEGIDKELCGQVAASIEQLTQRAGYDPRIFQDGIWICSKADKEV